MNTEPDTKDWTWVLHTPCAECGLTAGDVPPDEIGGRTLADLPRWQAVLSRVEARERPTPTTWSPTEYACHVRDVFLEFDGRVRLMLEQDDPVFTNWDQDEAAIADDYASQLPSEVSSQLVAAGTAFVTTLDSVPADSWDRTGLRDNGAAFTVSTLAQYFLHDVVHHLHDVRG
ncbi:DinB family protein [Aeromicrobium sp.]|uniref:DinB family protein n=1 Tax=Aeromicrobium sp. TaxID=1871063 RepID=UPI0019A2265B|nr:DinB family protein [Aeromicrobium sp.]MBC7631497.1 DinB family protein [Aeromicrobium sp.]